MKQALMLFVGCRMWYDRKQNYIGRLRLISFQRFLRCIYGERKESWREDGGRMEGEGREWGGRWEGGGRERGGTIEGNGGGQCILEAVI